MGQGRGAAPCTAAAVGAELGSQPPVSAPRAVGVTDWGRPGNSGGNSGLSATMLWVCGGELSGDKPRFADWDQQMWVSPLLPADGSRGVRLLGLADGVRG